jgi:hypothetical protein
MVSPFNDLRRIGWLWIAARRHGAGLIEMFCGGRRLCIPLGNCANCPEAADDCVMGRVEPNACGVDISNLPMLSSTATELHLSAGDS